MALSPKQQTMFRGLVSRAWAAFCTAERLDPKDRTAMDVWRRQQMHAAVGVVTTKDASKTRDFVPLMARFEVILGEDIYWQRRLDGDELRRRHFALEDVMSKHDVNPEYVVGIARQMFDTHRLDRLNDAQVEAIITALKRHLGIYTGPRPGAQGNKARKPHADRAEEASLSLA